MQPPTIHPNNRHLLRDCKRPAPGPLTTHPQCTHFLRSFPWVPYLSRSCCCSRSLLSAQSCWGWILCSLPPRRETQRRGTPCAVAEADGAEESSGESGFGHLLLMMLYSQLLLQIGHQRENKRTLVAPSELQSAPSGLSVCRATVLNIKSSQSSPCFSS